MTEKNIMTQGLTKNQWKEFYQLLARANKEQIQRMVLIASNRLEGQNE